MISYWNNICEIQQRQTDKGVRTYGQRLEDNTSMTDIERLEYLEEELIDGLMYIEHLKVKLQDMDKLQREIFGLKTKIKNLQERLDKRETTYGFRNW